MKKIAILFSAVILGILSSCSDSFLDVSPKAALSSTTLQNKIGVNALLVGAYALLDGWATAEGAYRSYNVGADNWVYGSVASDDAHKGTNAGDQPPISLIETGNIASDNIYFRGKWRGMYDGIARSNDVIQNLAKATDFTDAERAQITAEARFLRGNYHFELKKMYNMVPYIDDKTYDPNNLESTKLPNSTDIYPNIEADLKAAYDVLPTSQSQPGRPTKWAAGALLSKVYLFQKKYAEAKTILEAIVASGKYSLMAKYHDNFQASTNNNAESIFEVEYSVNDGAAGGENGNIGSTLNYPYGGGAFTTCCGFFQPSNNLVNAFKTDANGLPLLDTYDNSDIPNDQGIESTAPFTPYTGPLDPRLDWTVGRRGIPYLDWGVHPGKAYVRDQTYGGPYSPKKHVSAKADPSFASNNRLNANNFRMIRYAQVLLWLAEIETEIGSLDKARAYVNQIRARAARPEGFVKNADGTAAANYVIKEYSTTWPDQAYARKAVRFEERLELGMEGNRRYDLVRWGIAAETMNAYYLVEGTKRAYLKGSQFVKGKHEYFPIPIQEILNSQVGGKPTLTQNSGY
ncbi:RagB/SusD family nutrient uptake outer membrane protein [Dyadobacter frigoris]|uniref:RagB/SusD family nutrient uptake outer membrane protein n=1 Tax=Dyadobacter frigoris TaxID=2576211 RepID=A0A4U6D189_9BACT|nr:RagB/SusD family nutrient uptake outer membrane protein [Dyadobacter frigoris]TKT89548.1 RagB/SusD family nutrient uptake outer membrane protein [Dyadobacter frigoris]GLU54242.1 glycan metabolism protein RagB [Dyadobacter frigoris]